MAKAKTLRDELLSERPDIGRGSEPWHHVMRRDNPAMMKELDKIIDDWNRGDPDLRRVKIYKVTLAKWIKEKAGIKRNHQAIVDYINERANGQTARGA